MDKSTARQYTSFGIFTAWNKTTSSVEIYFAFNAHAAQKNKQTKSSKIMISSGSKGITTATFDPVGCLRVAGLIINPRHACARVTVLVLSVCLCVCLSVCVSVCVFSLFWHLAQSGVQTAVSATSARYGHEI